MEIVLVARVILVKNYINSIFSLVTNQIFLSFLIAYHYCAHAIITNVNNNYIHQETPEDQKIDTLYL